MTIIEKQIKQAQQEIEKSTGIRFTHEVDCDGEVTFVDIIF